MRSRAPPDQCHKVLGVADTEVQFHVALVIVRANRQYVNGASFRFPFDDKWNARVGVQAARQCRPERHHLHEKLMLSGRRRNRPRILPHIRHHRGRGRIQFGPSQPGLNPKLFRRDRSIIDLRRNGDREPQGKCRARNRPLDLHSRHLSHDRSGRAGNDRHRF